MIPAKWFRPEISVDLDGKQAIEPFFGTVVSYVSEVRANTTISLDRRPAGQYCVRVRTAGVVTFESLTYRSHEQTGARELFEKTVDRHSRKESLIR